MLLTYFGQVCHPMLVVEEVRPMHPLSRDGSGYHRRQPQVRIYRPRPDRHGHSRIHHVEEQGEGVGLGVLGIINRLENQDVKAREFVTVNGQIFTPTRM